MRCRAAFSAVCLALAAAWGASPGLCASKGETRAAAQAGQPSASLGPVIGQAPTIAPLVQGGGTPAPATPGAVRPRSLPPAPPLPGGRGQAAMSASLADTGEAVLEAVSGLAAGSLAGAHETGRLVEGLLSGETLRRRGGAEQDAVEDIQGAELRQDLEARLGTDFAGFRIARFGPNEYAARHEPVLRALGVDLIIIENPSPFDLELRRPEAGYFHKPEKVVWRLSAQGLEPYLAGLNSKARYRFKAALKKSEETLVELEPLSAKDFEEWYPLYEKEIVERERGRRVIPADWARERKNLGDYRKLFFRDPKTRELIGGAILKLNKKEQVLTIAYAAYASAHRDRELSLKTFAEALEHARQNGYHQLSYGRDSNLYGHHLTVGLMQYKSSLGFVPAPGGNPEIVKVLSPDKLGEEYFFFAFQENGRLAGLHASASPRKLSTPPGVPILTTGREQPAVSGPPRRVLEFLAGVRALEQANQLVELYLDIYHPGKRRFVDIRSNEQARTDPLNRALILVHFLTRGFGHIDFFLEQAASRGLIQGSSAKAPLALARGSLEDPDFAGKLAAFLGEGRDHYFWQLLLPELAWETLGSLRALEPAYKDESQWMLRDFLAGVRELHGSASLGRVIERLHALFDLGPFLEGLGKIRPVPAQAGRGHLTPDLPGLDGYFAPENRGKARRLLAELHGLLMRTGLARFGHWRYGWGLEETLTETIGGAAAGALRLVLDLEPEERGELADPNEWGEAGLGAKLRQGFSELDGIILRDREPGRDPLEREFSLKVGALAPYEGGVMGLLMASRIDPRPLDPWGRRPDEELREVYSRATNEQLLEMIRVLQVKNPGRRDELSALAARVAARPEPGHERPLPALELDPGRVERLTKRLSGMLVTAAPASWPSLLRFFCGKLGIGLLSAAGRSAQSLASALVQEHWLKHGRLPGAEEAELDSWQRELSLGARDPAEAARWLGEHPEAAVSRELAADLLERLGRAPEKESYEAGELVFLLAALGDEELADRARARLRAIPRDAFFAYFVDRETGKPRDSIIERNLARLGRTARQAQAISEAVLRLLGETLPTKDAPGLLSGRFVFGYHLLRGLGLDLQPFWEILSRHASLDPRMAGLVLHELVPMEGAGAGPARVFHRILQELPNDSVEWLTASLHLPQLFAQAPWPEQGFERPNAAILAWAAAKARGGTLNGKELHEIALWAVRHPGMEAADETLFAAAKLMAEIQDKDLRRGIATALAGRLSRLPLKTPDLYPRLSAFFEEIDPLGELGLLQEVFANQGFLLAHPWRAYGYPMEVSEKLRAFSYAEDFTPGHADLLLSLLFSHNGKAFNRLWIARLVASAPDKGFHTLVRFLQYWKSLSQENRDGFLSGRMDELLADIRLRAAREALGSPYEAAKRQAEEQRRTGRQVPASLAARLERLEKRRELLKAHGEAPSQEEQDRLRAQLNADLLAESPPKIEPETERELLIAQQAGGFARRLGPAGPSQERTARFLSENAELLHASGILDRFTQYSGFAAPSGLVLLKKVIGEYADPGLSRVVEVVRPDLGGRTTRHFDYFGKFRKLAAALAAAGVAEDEAKAFLARWSPLWRFGRIAGGAEDFLSVTHDLERWAKHGEEPCPSCQKLSSKSGNMRLDNWNYRFGPNPNADGRPLGRILLAQLKLAEYRRGHRVLARTLLEVTVEKRQGRPRLALLVELVYHDFQFTKTGPFLDAIADYARSLGIDRGDVHFAGRGAPPVPLPEEHRIYRDSFHPAAS